MAEMVTGSDSSRERETEAKTGIDFRRPFEAEGGTGSEIERERNTKVQTEAGSGELLRTAPGSVEKLEELTGD